MDSKIIKMGTPLQKYKSQLKAAFQAMEAGQPSQTLIPLGTHAIAYIPPPLPPRVKYLGSSQAAITVAEQLPSTFDPAELTENDISLHIRRIENIFKDRASQLTVKAGLELFLHGLQRGKGSRPRPPPSDGLESDGSRTSSSSSSKSKSSRDSRSSNLAKQRDGEKCILTQSTIKTAGAYIIPMHLGRDPTADAEGSKMPWWQLIRLYCGEEYYDWLKSFLLEPDEEHAVPINRLENIISLDANVHGMFDDGLISFKPQFPISPNATSYKLQLCFNTKHKRSTLPSIPLTEEIEFLTIPEDGTFNGKWLHREVAPGRLEQLSDGYIFEVSTDDIAKKPLPNPNLLLLHHHLAVACRCSGMGEIDEEWFEDDEDDDSEMGGFEKKRNSGIVSLNILLRSTPLPTVSSLQEITPSLLVDLYEVLFLVKLPYSTPRDPSPESQLRNIRILIGTIAHNVLQMDLSFIDPRKICDGDERALLEFLKIFVGVANLRRIYPAGARNLNGSLRQISGAGGRDGGGGGGGGAKNAITNGQATQLTIAVKCTQPRDVEVRHHEIGHGDTRTALTSESGAFDGYTSEETCSPGRSASSVNNDGVLQNGQEEDGGVDSFIGETVIIPQTHPAENNIMKPTQPGVADEDQHHELTMTTTLSDVTSIAPDVIERLNERVALQAVRIQRFNQSNSPSEDSEHPTILKDKDEPLGEEARRNPVLNLNGQPKSRQQTKVPEPSAVPLPTSFSISDDESIHLVESEDGYQKAEYYDTDESRKAGGDEKGKEKGNEDERATSSSASSGRSRSEKSRSRRAMTASPSKVDPRYLSPEKTPIIGFDTSPSATMAYKAELRASFSESLSKEHEGTFVWDPTPPDVQTRPLMEFNSFYSTADTTAEHTRHMLNDEAAVNLDFAVAVTDALESSMTDEDEPADRRAGEDEEHEEHEEHEEYDEHDVHKKHEEHEEAEDGESDEEDLPDGRVFDEEDEDPIKAAAPKSMIPRLSASQRKGPDKTELLRFFSGQRPIAYRKSFQRPSNASTVARAKGSKMPKRVSGDPSPRPASPVATSTGGTDDHQKGSEAIESTKYGADAAKYEAVALKDATENDPEGKELITPKEDVVSATPVISTEESVLVQDDDDSGSEPSPSPMPRSRPMTVTALPSLTTLFSPEISAFQPSPTKGFEAEEEGDEEDMPPSPSSVATSDVSVSTVAWEDSPATAALKRKRFEAMEARRQARGSAKVGSKVAKLALYYGSWRPRSGHDKPRAPNGTSASDEEMDDVPSEGREDDDGDEDDEEEVDVTALEEELRQLSGISMRESVKQTNLFRILMKSR